jgi:hypothetical protein
MDLEGTSVGFSLTTAGFWRARFIVVAVGQVRRESESVVVVVGRVTGVGGRDVYGS